MAVPLIVVEGDARAFEVAVAQAGRAGWLVRPGWHVPAPAHRVVLAGPVRDRAEAAAALVAAVAGAGLVVHALAPRDVVDMLCEDLRRLGRLDHRLPGGSPAVDFDATERALLDLLLDGASVTTAADRLHISRSTADRRLAAIRERLGVASTAQAVVAYRRLPAPIAPPAS